MGWFETKFTQLSVIASNLEIHISYGLWSFHFTRKIIWQKCDIIEPADKFCHLSRMSELCHSSSYTCPCPRLTCVHVLKYFLWLSKRPAEFLSPHWFARLRVHTYHLSLLPVRYIQSVSSAICQRPNWLQLALFRLKVKKAHRVQLFSFCEGVKWKKRESELYCGWFG